MIAIGAVGLFTFTVVSSGLYFVTPVSESPARSYVKSDLRTRQCTLHFPVQHRISFFALAATKSVKGPVTRKVTCQAWDHGDSVIVRKADSASWDVICMKPQ